MNGCLYTLKTNDLDDVFLEYNYVKNENTVKPPSNGHFGTNINSNGFSPVYRGCPL